MKGLRITIAVLMSLTFTFLLCCTILGWENLTAKEKKEFTKAELDSSYNEGFTAGEESNQSEIANLLAQYQQLNHTLEHLQEDYAEVQTNYATLSSQKTELENTVAELQSSNEDKSAEITNLNTQLENVNNQITQLENEKVELNNTINNLNNQVAQLEQQLKDAGITFDCYKCGTSGTISQSCSNCEGRGTINNESEATLVKIGDNLRGKTISSVSSKMTFEGMEDYLESNLGYGDLSNKIRTIAGAYGGIIMPDDKDYIVSSMNEYENVVYRELCPTCNGSMMENVSCPVCGGDGKTDIQYVTCSECNGMNYSYYQCDSCNGTASQTCSGCNGSGTQQCYDCGGDGTYDDHKVCESCGSWIYPDSESGEYPSTCNSCSSSSLTDTCTNCNGGQMACSMCQSYGSSGVVPCSPCMGSGQKYEQCHSCNGEGYTAVA